MQPEGNKRDAGSRRRGIEKQCEGGEKRQSKTDEYLRTEAVMG